MHNLEVWIKGKIGYKRRIHLMNELVPGLSSVSLKGCKENNEKMCVSNEKLKINKLDTAKNIRKKINATYCLAGDSEDNTHIILLNKIIFPILNRLNKSFLIEKSEKFGGEKIIYNTYDEVVQDITNNKLHPADFKLGIINALIEFL